MSGSIFFYIVSFGPSISYFEEELIFILELTFRTEINVNRSQKRGVSPR